jgi:ABC-2 type transport system ATP-binding protein
MSEVTIGIDDVFKSYGRTKALDGVSFDLEKGVSGLLGPNGAGKTTLLRMLATVLAPDRGRLAVLGWDPLDVAGRLEIRRRLGYFPQEPGYHMNFTAFEFVDYLAILKEMVDTDRRHDEVRRVLEAVSLGDVASKKLKALSGGMRRRVILAQALLGSPELLVLDEPTVGLDPVQRLRFREILSQLAETQTILLSTHMTEDVAALCSQVVVLNEGQVQFNGDITELADKARGRVWQAGAKESARLSWRTGEGIYRHVGEPPAGAELVEPTIDDGYLLLIGERALEGQPT